MDYAEEVEQFMTDSEQYMMEVERVVEVNTIVETIVTAVSWKYSLICIVTYITSEKIVHMEIRKVGPLQVE